MELKKWICNALLIIAFLVPLSRLLLLAMLIFTQPRGQTMGQKTFFLNPYGQPDRKKNVFFYDFPIKGEHSKQIFSKNWDFAPIGLTKFNDYFAL